MNSMNKYIYRIVLLFVTAGLTFSALPVIAAVSDGPDTPFKLVTFAVQGEDRPGMVLDGRIIDLARANRYLVRNERLADRAMPAAMLELIENYASIRPRLYQLANYLHGRTDALEFAYRPDEVTVRAPVRYPWNLLNAALNYRKHDEEMTGSERPVDPERDAPYLFAKSPRSTIADPGEPFVIPPGREAIDWEGELAVIIGRQVKNATLESAMDSVFGFTILHDISDRAMPHRAHPRFNADWFSMKNRDGAAPMGPYIVPAEFLPEYGNLDIRTYVNDRLMQDSNTRYMVYSVAHLIRYITSVMTLYPGDVIATGTPDGVGAGRKPPVFLKRGDEVRITIEGIGTLVTPFE